jgi:hypothetical protein
MPTLETLTAGDLSNLLPASILRQATGYVNRILNPMRSGPMLTAEVRDTYLLVVEVGLVSGGLRTNCGCGYTMNGYCKHSAALLLKWLQDPASFGVVEEKVLGPNEYPIEAIPVELPPTYRPSQLPAWVTTCLADRHRQDRQQLEAWLEAIKLQDLRAMARERGWKVKGTRKSDVTRQIADQIADPESIRRAVSSLDVEHRQVLRALVLLGGEAPLPLEDLEPVAKMGGVLKSYKQVATYTRHLWQMGLALPGELRGGYSAWNDFIPPDVGRHLPPLLDGAIPAPDNLPANTLASGLRLADPLALVRAANQIAVLLEQAPVPLRPPAPRPRLERFYPELKNWDYDPFELAQVEKSGQLRKRAELALTVPPPGRILPDEAIERLAPLAGGEGQLDFLYALLVAAGIFQPGSPTTVWPEIKVEYLRRDELAQRTLLARTYLHVQSWNELWEVLRTTEGLQLKRNPRYPYVKPEHLLSDLVHFRHLVLRTLASLPDGRWVTLADLLPLMRTIWPRFDQSVWSGYRHPSFIGAWLLAREGKPLRQDNPADWNLAQGNFIQQVLGGPLHWLGFADLHFDGETLVAFRLHGLADLLWDRVEVVRPPRHATDLVPDVAPAEAVTIDDLSIRVNPSAVSGQTHSFLDKIARLDVVEADSFVYRLDAQAAYEAFERGAILSEIMDDWASLLPIPMSEPIRAKLTAWWQTYGRVRIYENLVVVEFGDDYALTEMKAVTALEQYLLAEISPRLVIIRADGVEPLVGQLERAGYTPKQTEEV